MSLTALAMARRIASLVRAKQARGGVPLEELRGDKKQLEVAHLRKCASADLPNTKSLLSQIPTQGLVQNIKPVGSS